MSFEYEPKAPRWVIALAIPVCMVLGFTTTLIREIGSAFKYAWLEAMIELESGKLYLKSPPANMLTDPELEEPHHEGPDGAEQP